MKNKRLWITGVILGSLLGTSVYAQEISALYQEFLRRDKMRMNSKQGQVINFLKAMKFPTEDITELEVLDDDLRFLIRDRKDQVCLGDVKISMLRCKNSLGLSTVLFQGDSD